MGTIRLISPFTVIEGNTVNSNIMDALYATEYELLIHIIVPLDYKLNAKSVSMMCNDSEKKTFVYVANDVDTNDEIFCRLTSLDVTKTYIVINGQTFSLPNKTIEIHSKFDFRF